MSKYYNPESNEKFEEATIDGGNPTGIVNSSRTPHKWALSLWNLSKSYDWYISECKLSSDSKNYKSLPEKQKYAFDMALAQLIGNDSMQTSQLLGSIANHITSPMVAGCIARQANDEFLHSLTYTTATEEICEDVEKIYSMDQREPALRRKNMAVAEMYEKVTVNDDTPTHEELMVAYAANLILERLVFPGGFVTLWSFNWSGVNKAISFIERDETGFHVPLFKNIFNSSKRERGVSKETEEKISIMVKHMCEEEKIWTKHITKDLLGFSENAVDMYIEDKANDVLKYMKIKPLYKETNGGPLKVIEDDRTLLKSRSNSNGGDVKVRENFFEGSVSQYDRIPLDDDF